MHREVKKNLTTANASTLMAHENSIFESGSPANANRARKSDICAVGVVAVLKRVDRNQARDPMKVTPPTAAFVLRTSSASIVNGVKRINRPVYEVINGLPLRD